MGSDQVVQYSAVPKLWTDTIEAHRREVRDATLDTAAALVVKHGLLSVTMSQIAEETGIGRATLYKYFPDVEAILIAWHERQIARHLEQLAEIRDRPGEPGERLQSVLEAYADIVQQSRGHSDRPLAAALHDTVHKGRAQHQLHHFFRDRPEHKQSGQHQLHQLIRDVLAEGASAGQVRDDVAPDELATFCIHSLEAAGGLPSKAAVRRLVAVTLSGLKPER